MFLNTYGIKNILNNTYSRYLKDEQMIYKYIFIYLFFLFGWKNKQL
jgi:hypothetical protein